MASECAQRPCTAVCWPRQSTGPRHRTQGVLGGEEVVLHLWARVVPPRARRGNTTQAAVRGFAVMLSKKSVPAPGEGVQLLHAEGVLYFSDQVFLWCVQVPSC